MHKSRAWLHLWGGNAFHIHVHLSFENREMQALVWLEYGTGRRNQRNWVCTHAQPGQTVASSSWACNRDTRPKQVLARGELRWVLRAMMIGGWHWNQSWTQSCQLPRAFLLCSLAFDIRAGLWEAACKDMGLYGYVADHMPKALLQSYQNDGSVMPANLLFYIWYLRFIFVDLMEMGKFWSFLGPRCMGECRCSASLSEVNITYLGMLLKKYTLSADKD
jgi:hypothetical protein